MPKQIFHFDDDTSYIADDFINGCLINPLLPDGFNTVAISKRDQEHLRHWYGLSFVIHDEQVYSVHCLDGKAWDRSICWGVFRTLDDALNCAQDGPSWRNRFRDLAQGNVTAGQGFKGLLHI